MAYCNAVFELSGTRGHNETKIKTFDELVEIGERTSSVNLDWQTLMCRLAVLFWMRQYKDFAELSEIYPCSPSTGQKRCLTIARVFYEGIAHLNLARDTRQPKWRLMGENAVIKIAHLERTMSKWNLEHKSKLLQAELHYLDGRIESAADAYKASIKSARERKFINDEALACELYGIFCVENHMANEGSKQLHMALEKYKLWGAIKKVNEVQLLINLINPASFWKPK